MITVIPAIDIMSGKCVRLSQGDYSRCTIYNTEPVEMAKKFAGLGFSRIHVVDLDGAKSSHPCNMAVLEQLATVTGIQIEWGGGIKTEQALQDIFNAGAAHAVIGSIAARTPKLMGQWLQTYGSDRIVLGADINKGQVAVNGWTDNAEMSATELIRSLLPYGLSQVIYTEISRDGMFSGPAMESYREIMNSFPKIILTASGGIGSMEDVITLNAAGVPRVIIGKAIYEGRISLDELSIMVGKC